MDAAKRHLDAFLWFAGVLGAVSTVYGLAKGDFWSLTATAGYIGIAALLPAGVLGGLGMWSGERPGADTAQREIVAAVGCAAFGAVSHLLFPFTDAELRSTGGPNALSLVGVVVIGVVFAVGVSLYWQWQRLQAPARKACPDCANEVLAAANVCQHCGFRFAPVPKAPVR